MYRNENLIKHNYHEEGPNFVTQLNKTNSQSITRIIIYWQDLYNRSKQIEDSMS